MLQIHTLTLGMFQTNTYIIHDDSSNCCCVIDPGYDAAAIFAKADALGLKIEAILLTHGHFDHVGAVKDLSTKTGCKVYLCPEDLTMPAMITAGTLYYTDTYVDGDVLELCGLTIRVLHTPGHTPGSVCLLTGSTMFSGDTLFAGSCGRTDLPGGDWATMLNSLRQLSLLQSNYSVYPGHGESTTLDAERQYNPYMR